MMGFPDEITQLPLQQPSLCPAPTEMISTQLHDGIVYGSTVFGRNSSFLPHRSVVDSGNMGAMVKFTRVPCHETLAS